MIYLIFVYNDFDLEDISFVEAHLIPKAAYEVFEFYSKLYSKVELRSVKISDCSICNS